MKALIENKTITSLNLSCNNLGNGKTENMEMLMEGLSQNNTIKIFNLKMNEFGAGYFENLDILGKALIQNKAITSLDLTENDFHKKPENLEILRNIFSQTKTIKSINLYLNYLGCIKDALNNNLMFMKALIQNKTLSEILLENNYEYSLRMKLQSYLDYLDSPIHFKMY